MAYHQYVQESLDGACCAPCASGRACTAASMAVGGLFDDLQDKADAVLQPVKPAPKPAVAATPSSHLGLLAVVGAATLGVVLLARRRRRR